ncbi:dTDP-4-dehydrorhamnose reductase [Winogradskyella sp.]|uniref:dTDP-4-dehydrorhamnose reductase n=1 Tax=Winogradskyella sp. TaxID=1883156 RepID=UPI00262067C9|nr:dTDP-4-dehydrorhamnose reductase [Winogradskyella sp.]
MKQIAILGSNGQLGKTLKYLEVETNYVCKFYTRNELDITNKLSIETIFNKNSFDFCINCAAYTNVEEAEKDIESTFLVNALGVRNIAEVCKSKGITLIHISTDYVFDGTKRSPYKTSDITNPINEYGKSKLKGEQFIREVLTKYYIIRTSWLYSVYGKNFMKTIINKIADNTVLSITTEETGTPTSCFDLATFIFYLVRKNDIPYGIYNFSAKGSTTWFGFAHEIAKLYNPDKQKNIKKVETFKTLAKRPKYSVLDISNTEKVYKDLNKWEDSLSKTLELYRL